MKIFASRLECRIQIVMQNYRNNNDFILSNVFSLIFFFQTKVPGYLLLITIAMVHVYVKYLFVLFSIAVNNINFTPYPELDNKIAFLPIFYITTYKNPEIVRFSRKRTKIYDTKKIAKQKNFLK